MNKILITNIEKIVSGDIRNPILEGDSILVVDGKITEIGIASKMDLSSLTTQIDAQKCVLIPGLIDSHQHPGIGDYTPTRGVSMIGWTTGKLWGGVTTIISAGEIHLPGRPMDRAGTKAMAIYLHKSFSLIRPSGIKVHGGALCITPDLIEADFEELSRNGVWIVGEVCAPFSIPDPKIVAPLTKLAHKYGMKVQMHVSGTRISAEEVEMVDPDIVSHVNGGHCGLRPEVMERIVSNTRYFIEIVPHGNPVATQEVITFAKKINGLDRIIIGSDDPGGLGLAPLGVLSTVLNISALHSIPAEIALSMATGNTARVYGLDTGIIERDKCADFVLLSVSPDTSHKNALKSIEAGDMPVVKKIFVDGKVINNPIL